MESVNQPTQDDLVRILRDVLVYLCDDNNINIHSDGADDMAAVVVDLYMAGYSDPDEIRTICRDPDYLAFRKYLKTA